jgi:small subunit ribosomal protein S17
MSNKTFEGTVVSNKMQKTLVVVVTKKFKETRTSKIVKSHKKYKIHSEDATVRNGDLVSFVECRPISKEKKFRLLGVLKKAEALATSTVDEPS